MPNHRNYKVYKRLSSSTSEGAARYRQRRQQLDQQPPVMGDNFAQACSASRRWERTEEAESSFQGTSSGTHACSNSTTLQESSYASLCGGGGDTCDPNSAMRQNTQPTSMGFEWSARNKTFFSLLKVTIMYLVSLSKHVHGSLDHFDFTTDCYTQVSIISNCINRTYPQEIGLRSMKG